jgi:ABC-type uncharacterized transport system substrate-binding protein
MKRREFITLFGSAAATWPLAARAQQAEMPVIGFLHASSTTSIGERMDAFRGGLKESGYVEGRNLMIEYRWAEGHYDRLPSLAGDLVARHVAVIVAATSVGSVAAKASSSTIPMVFTGVGGDPVKLGLVASLNRPGGNMTGIAMQTILLSAKRLEILGELVPKATTIGFLINPNNPNTDVTLQQVPEAAGAIGKKLVFAKAASEADFDSAFTSIVQQGATALLVDADPFFYSRRDQLVALAERRSLPAIYEFREFTTIGGLVSYAPDVAETYRLAGVYTARILKGEKPDDLPVQQPTKFELAVNLKTAKALGLTVPPSLLARADVVVE